MRQMFNEVLNEEIRERRAWAYSISSSYCNFRHFHEFLISCQALAPEALDEIEEVIEVCIASMRDHEELFKQAKRHALASTLMIDPTGRGICDGALEDLSEGQRIISLAQIGSDLEQVTMNDIKNLLQWLGPDRRWTLITRP